jgi:hypothetical protein
MLCSLAVLDNRPRQGAPRFRLVEPTRAFEVDRDITAEKRCRLVIEDDPSTGQQLAIGVSLRRLRCRDGSGW